MNTTGQKIPSLEKYTEEYFRSSEEKFSLVFKHSPNGMCISTVGHGRYVDVNDLYVHALGYTREELIGINTALQVDVLGQVCSQSIGSRHFSGTGGQLDTHRGAQMSPGGRGIIALRSTAKDGTVSTIVPQLSLGAEVTVPSHDVDTVVTEFGVAELRGRCLRDRMTALIGIAHPDFRPWLWEEVRRLGI